MGHGSEGTGEDANTRREVTPHPPIPVRHAASIPDSGASAKKRQTRPRRAEASSKSLGWDQVVFSGETGPVVS